MGNIVPDKTRIEHDPLRNAKRVVQIDPYGGVLTVGNLSIAIDEADSSTTYIGIAQIATSTSAASWQIKKLSVSGNVTTITWADGDDIANNIWNDRASLTYL